MYSLRLVLVGKTGAGKSSAGNTILGKEEFKAGLSFKAVTTECQRGEGEVDGRTVMVVDTPGIGDLTVSREDAKDRVAECFPMSAPGPHAFLLVIKLGRFTPEEKQAADVIREVFGEAALKRTIVLFTHGDELENPDNLETLLADSDELTHLLGNVNWRYHVFNNKMDDRTQVIQLLNKIDKMLGERGQHYTSEQFQEAEEKRKEEQEKERMRREMEELRQDWYDKPEVRILLFGKCTASNRTASKIILEERHQYLETEGCQKINEEVLGRRVSVVETPGLSDMKRTSKDIMKEMRACICLTSPGPHAFVIVEKLGQKSTEREDILKLIKDVFGDQALKYVILLAIETREKHVHSFDYEYSHSTDHSRLLEHHASKAPYEHEHLPTHIFEDSRNLKQITSLLQKIDRMVERNGGSFFTNDMYSEVERAIRQVQNKILEKRMLKIRKEKCDIRWEGEENSLEWKIEMIKARKQAEHDNSFKNGCTIAACAAVGLPVIGAATGGAAVGGAAAVGSGLVGTIAGGFAAVEAAAIGAIALGAAVGRTTAVKAAAVGALAGAAVAGGATAGGAVVGGSAEVVEVLGAAGRVAVRKVARTVRNILNMQ